MAHFLKKGFVGRRKGRGNDFRRNGIWTNSASQRLQGIYHENQTIDEQENAHKNILGYNDDFSMDVPPPMDNILIYRATLGHKANHAFKPNTMFGTVKNPRFVYNQASGQSYKHFLSVNYDTRVVIQAIFQSVPLLSRKLRSQSAL